jgi:hypothetical protein
LPPKRRKLGKNRNNFIKNELELLPQDTRYWGIQQVLFPCESFQFRPKC